MGHAASRTSRRREDKSSDSLKEVKEMPFKADPDRLMVTLAAGETNFWTIITKAAVYTFCYDYKGKYPVAHAIFGIDEKHKVLSAISLILGGFIFIPLKALAKLFAEMIPLVGDIVCRNTTKRLLDYARNKVDGKVDDEDRSMGLRVLAGIAGALLSIPTALLGIVHFFTRSFFSPLSGATEAYEGGKQASGTEQNKTSKLGVLFGLGRFVISIAMLTIASIFAVPIIIGGIAQAVGLLPAVKGIEWLSHLPQFGTHFFGMLTPMIQSIMPLATYAAVAAIALWSAVITTVGLGLKQLIDKLFARSGSPKEGFSDEATVESSVQMRRLHDPSAQSQAEASVYDSYNSNGTGYYDSSAQYGQQFPPPSVPTLTKQQEDEYARLQQQQGTSPFSTVPVYNGDG